ncbi:lysophospholipid acyltransferase family protein [Bacillus sp. FJAT-45350]|uniref:lysophospholipid acyltransferase family protein n=1 Tax=Bacillus sp. FJAT-45350 TaxID=2011014 RepID=UPI000BB83BC6|nr:lysophospholipid acyltransferase family protein [Bacillus sp. FJAT-45350]
MDTYVFGQTIFRTYLRSFYKPEVIGSDNIPKEGPVILCCNHISNLDPPFLGCFIERPINFMAKAELFDIPVLKGLLPKVGAFPVKRGMGDKQALRNGLAILKEDNMLGLFPEGTRSKDGELGKGLTGAGFFALRTNAVILPCAIIGPFKKFNKIKLVYGEPLDFTEYRELKKSADEATEYIMEGIRSLIEEHRV